jgi:galactonate dehydratase
MTINHKVNFTSQIETLFSNSVSVNISKVETFITKKIICENNHTSIKPFLLIKLTTDLEISGWGEAFITDESEKAVVEYLHGFTNNKNFLHAINPLILRKYIDSKDDSNSNFNLMCAFSAFEMALWDIAGKIQSKSLSEMLGCSINKPVEIYINTWSDTKTVNRDIIDYANYIRNQKFNSIKVYPLQNRGIEKASLFLGNLRKEVGELMDIMIDLECPRDISVALELEKKIIDYDPYWYEEPIEGNKILDLKNYKDNSNFKIVSGEKQAGIIHFSSLIKHHAVDIINPDISAVGGIIYMLEIASIAANKNILLSPHCWNSMTIAGSVMIHICNIISNNEMAEIFPEYFSLTKNFSSPAFSIESGKALLIDRPGIGVIVDEVELKNFTKNHRVSIC